MNGFTIFAVASGGALGAVARYGAHRWISGFSGVDAAWSTLWINVAGAFGLGLAASLLVTRTGVVPPFIMIGVLGAFTTFSTFALDAITLFRDRGISAAGLYVVLSVVLAIAAAAVGLWMGRALL